MCVTTFSKAVATLEEGEGCVTCVDELLLEQVPALRAAPIFSQGRAAQ